MRETAQSSFVRNRVFSILSTCRGRVAVLPFIALLILGACSKAPQMSSQQTREYNAVFANAVWTPAVQARWAHSCALCHVAGEGGAPRIGRKDDWAPRLAKGRAVLLKHTVEGFNRMPPLGYCMECELSDFAAMIDMMSGQRQ